ncbi:roadblock/LC7 domain-containing protein [Streptomyces canus]|uniref:roadblock/LC7 domain-containing protein n=1 Tax=Streptomyces canus TaxID=58343 RepID=UPI0036EFFA56
MSETTTTGQTGSSDLTWLLDNFKARLSGVDTVLVVSTDGLATRTCTGLTQEDAEHLSAIASGSYMLMSRADAHFKGPGDVRQFVAQLSSRVFFLTEAAVNSILVVITSRESDVGLVGHEMKLLAHQVQSHLGTKSRSENTAG